MKFRSLFLAGMLIPALYAAEKSAEPPFGTIVINGALIKPVRMSMVEASSEHLNFCFAHRFPDGSIYLSHSAGIHTVTEHGHRDSSFDGGRTWQPTVPDFGGFNAYTTRDGKKANIGCWDNNISATHTITRKILSDDGKSVTRETSEIKLPFESSFRLHREIAKLRDGRLLLTGYGTIKGDPKHMSFVVESRDDGKTWSFLATLMRDKEGKTPEGPNESAVIELANGDLLAVVRVGGTRPLHQLRSTDGGKTWQSEGEIAPFCVAPAMRILSNGALLIITGRPYLYLLVDLTGTGKNYQQVRIYKGSGSSYASVLETAPDEIMVVYDESDFSTWRNTGLFSRIMAMTLKIDLDPDAKTAQGADGWIRYAPGAGVPPEKARIFTVYGYQKPAPDRESWCELRSIPERPDKVLYLDHHGTGKQAAGTKFSHLRAGFDEEVRVFSATSDFRILDQAEDRPQLMYRFAFKCPGKPGVDFARVAFARDGVVYHDGDAGRLKKLAYPIGTTFHTMRISANADKGVYSVWLDGKEEPVITAKLAYHKDVSVGFCIGDGSTDTFGSADIASLAWKFSE